ncbi:MAG: hypothetical protein JXB14_00470 [Candidatus Altiarchaeota archaeon]|nr:hypothetical protein [Candidatus Altiarchaeota archaeon]
MAKEGYKRKIWRSCIVCGKRIVITVYKDGHYRGGEFFGKHDIPIEGTGEWKRIGTWKFLAFGSQITVVMLRTWPS